MRLLVWALNNMTLKRFVYFDGMCMCALPIHVYQGRVWVRRLEEGVGLPRTRVTEYLTPMWVLGIEPESCKTGNH